MFKIGDVVKATSDITRKDRRSFLKEGELAKITALWKTEKCTDSQYRNTRKITNGRYRLLS